jgi:hypothetical protein
VSSRMRMGELRVGRGNWQIGAHRDRRRRANISGLASMSKRGQLCLGSLSVLALVLAMPCVAGAVIPGASLTPSTTKPFLDCPDQACDAISDPPAVKTATGYRLPFATSALEGGGEDGGYDPQDLQSAYRIPTTGGSGQTVAIVDAYGDVTAESDLAKYREKYGLPSCIKFGGCFTKVNQVGEEGGYPRESEADWAVETSLDLDMVSAACPHCHILLVEANNGLPAETGAAVNEAVKLGANEISNSYGYPETYVPWCGETDCSSYEADYDHPGVLITASAGDELYDNQYSPGLEGKLSPDFPATSPYVVAVGGTALKKASNSRGWNEEVWYERTPEGKRYGTGSGCSLVESKPIWQTDSGCAKRTDNDVAADAACETPVSIYSTPLLGGWGNQCGTSASAPLIAGIEAHASERARALGGALFYSNPSSLFDITAGSNGSCTPPVELAYLCNAEVGYDGPTGNGTPDGIPVSTPTATTGAASSVTAAKATLGGTVNPEGAETKYYFEYGTTTSYGTSTPETSAGGEVGNVNASRIVSGLKSATTYHFRLVAVNRAGTVHGEDKIFSTSAVEWHLAGTELTESVTTTWKGKLKLSDSNSGAVVECEDAAEGPVEPGIEGEVTKWTTSKCVGVKACESSGVTVEALHLPWSTSLKKSSEGTIRDWLVSQHEPAGYKLKCKVLGLSYSDECTKGSQIEATMTNGSSGVMATFLTTPTFTCNGKSGVGSVESAQTIEASKGGKLEVIF